MLKPKLLYFFYYAAMATLLPFLVLYYAQLGLTGQQIGVLSALLPVMTLLGVPLWSAASDTTGRYRAFILLTVGGTLASTLLTSSVTTYFGLLASVGALTFFVAPVMPLADHVVLTLLKDQKHRYGSLRLVGCSRLGCCRAGIGGAGRIRSTLGVHSRSPFARSVVGRRGRATCIKSAPAGA